MAKSKKEITQFVKNFCQLYSLNYMAYFHDYDENDFPIPAPVFGESSIESKIPVISEYFGLTPDEILNTSEEGLNKWINKYSFFKHYPEFVAAYNNTYIGNSEEVESYFLIKAIFGGQHKIERPNKYKKEDIERRLIEKLKEIDTVMPGTYHKDAEITMFSFATEQFCSYPSICEMIRSLLQMVYRAKDLFYKAKETDLADYEIYEYNFLVTTLGIKDVASNCYLYYKNVVLLRDVYKKEGYKEFYSFAYLENYRKLNPYRAKEFLDNKELMQAYINEYAESYWEWKEESKKIAKIECRFAWTDAPELKLEDGNFQIPEMDDLDDDIRIPIMTTVFLDKTEEELGEDKENALKLIRCFGCAKERGLSIPQRELPVWHWRKMLPTKDFSRLIMHDDALRGNRK